MPKAPPFHFELARWGQGFLGVFVARINIEDSLAHDERMKAVIRKIGEALAFGEWYRIARCAQRYWTDEKNPIPQSVWEISEFNNIFIQVGIVKKTEGGLYLSGSEEFFSWIISKKENGRKGGVKSGAARKINDIIEANASGGEANASESKPLTLTPILAPTLIQIQNTGGEDKKPTNQKKVKFEIIESFKSIDDDFYQVIERMTEKQQSKLIDAYTLPVATAYIKKVGGWPKYSTVKDVYRTIVNWATRDGIKNQVEWKKQQDAHNRKLEKMESQKC